MTRLTMMRLGRRGCRKAITWRGRTRGVLHTIHQSPETVVGSMDRPATTIAVHGST